MEDVHINTMKIMKTGADINFSLGEIKVLMDELFRVITETNTKVGSWQGIASNKFLEYTLIGKENYDFFYTSLDDLSKFLQTFSEEMEEIINSIKR